VDHEVDTLRRTAESPMPKVDIAAGGFEGNGLTVPVAPNGSLKFVSAAEVVLTGCRRINRCSEKWCLAVELQVVFALQDVVKDPKAPRTTVFPLPLRSSAKPTRGAKSFLSGKFAPIGAFLSQGKVDPWRIAKACGLLTGSQREGASLRVDLRRSVFIAQAEVHCQVLE